jgi:hypothetical protein
MDGPIRSFVDTLSRQQPLRNAARGLFGLPRRSAVIDPMEEMAARDREMGGDVSNPYPQQKRMPVRQVSASEELPAPARQGVEMIPTPPPIDEKQPYKGQSVFTAMFRTPQDGLDAQRKTAGGAAGSPMAGGSPLSRQIAEINASDMEMPDKLEALSSLMATAASEATARGDRDAMQTLVRLSEGFAQRANAVRNSTQSQAIIQRNLEFREQAVPKQIAAYREEMERQRKLDAEEWDRRYGREQADAKELQSQSFQFQNVESPLVDDMSRSVAEWAFQQTAGAQQTRAKDGKPMSREEMDQMYDEQYRIGTRIRVGQYINAMVNEDGPAFDDTHPGFMELQAHYGRKLAEDEGQYDALYSDLMQAIAPAVRAAAPGLPQEDQAAYIRQIIEGDGENRGLLGPKVESGFGFGLGLF